MARLIRSNLAVFNGFTLFPPNLAIRSFSTNARVLGKCCFLLSEVRTESTGLICYQKRASSSTESHATNHDPISRNWQRSAMFATGTLIASGLLLYSQLSESKQCASVEDKANRKLPIYAMDEVAKHNNRKDGVWVTYDGGVFDITDFIEQHPGGSSKIILAAGGPLEPFWDMYAIHKKEEVLEILHEFQIGELRHEDRVVRKKDDQGPFSTDPVRHPALIMNSKQPFNAETPPQLATDNFLTPNELFFTRNHLPVPVVDEKEFRLEIAGNGRQSVKLSLEDLKSKFKEHTVVATLQCAGNRRSEMNSIKTVKGLNWYHNAISNAEWKGVLLRDVLVAAGIDPKSSNIKHVQFEGLDQGPTNQPYGSSVPSRYVFNDDSEVLLAYEMNGTPIPRDHGFPLRVIIPGVVGARNVKWLAKVIVSDEESHSHWQQNDYKGFSPNVDWGNVDFKTSPAIQELPVTSAVCSPQAGEAVHEDEEEVTVKGYAYSGGGRGIVRVDVSGDGGKTWHTATLGQGEKDLSQVWAWTLWEAVVPIPSDHKGKMEICCKAVDASYNCQPDSVEPIWNLRGVLNNAWHKVHLSVETDN